MIIRSLLALSIVFISANTFAYDAKSCQIKKEKLIQQLHHAKKYNNTNRVKGLERALARLDQKCSGYLKK